MVRLSASGKIAGRMEAEDGTPVVKYIDGKYQVGHIWNGEFHWSLSTLFDTWQAAIKDELAAFNFRLKGDFCWPFIQDKDGLFYKFSEMEDSYN